MEIRNDVIEYALGVLDVQNGHIKTVQNPVEQKLYYEGMRDMMTLLISQGHTSNDVYGVYFDPIGKHHKVLENEVKNGKAKAS